MNNSTEEEYCWYRSTGNTAYFIYDYLKMQWIFIFGMSAQFLLLMTFHQQSKKKTAYWYAAAQTLSDITVVITRAFYVLSFEILAANNSFGGVAWFESSYRCMWMAAHLVIPEESMFVPTSLLLSLAMSIDRIIALGKPIYIIKI